MLQPHAPAGYKGLLSSLGSASAVTCPSWGQGGDVPSASSCVQGQGTLGPVLHHAPGMVPRVVSSPSLFCIGAGQDISQPSLHQNPKERAMLSWSWQHPAPSEGSV